ncbi:MAG: YgaP family membrane protein [Gaiellaceae bacterium]
MRRPLVNITPAERAASVAVGLGGAIAGVWLLASASGVGPIALEVLLVLSGLDLVVTGALGHCPLYRRLGYVPRSMGTTR